MRGRICRGVFSGNCCIFADNPTDDAQQRLQAFVDTTDGFKLAEVDFQLRGAGDLVGTRQHGLPPFRVADLVRDSAIVAEAREDARKLIAADPGLSQPRARPPATTCNFPLRPRPRPRRRGLNSATLGDLPKLPLPLGEGWGEGA